MQQKNNNTFSMEELNEIERKLTGFKNTPYYKNVSQNNRQTDSVTDTLLREINKRKSDLWKHL